MGVSFKLAQLKLLIFGQLPAAGKIAFHVEIIPMLFHFIIRIDGATKISGTASVRSCSCTAVFAADCGNGPARRISDDSNES
jgi:hypothetical protein